ncbi:hypothetical protein V5799_017167 [Amblyomma americanum]|uniref:BPTI/Kunitz inhibitor domain-containing protein n=1 Tax=Amblyomma americanum TaxID=6943 RepID=A0AAQ4F3K0_AMBAM
MRRSLTTQAILLILLQVLVSTADQGNEKKNNSIFSRTKSTVLSVGVRKRAVRTGVIEVKALQKDTARGYNPGNYVTEKPTKPGRQPQCNLPKDPGWFTDDYSWEYYFDAENQFCILDFYKGGGGNNNRFPTCQLCMSACDTAKSSDHKEISRRG